MDDFNTRNMNEEDIKATILFTLTSARVFTNTLASFALNVDLDTVLHLIESDIQGMNQTLSQVMSITLPGRNVNPGSLKMKIRELEIMKSFISSFRDISVTLKEKFAKLEGENITNTKPETF